MAKPISDTPDLPLVGKSQSETWFLGFPDNSNVLKRIDDGHIESCVKAGLPVWDQDIGWPPIISWEKKLALQ